MPANHSALEPVGISIPEDAHLFLNYWANLYPAFAPFITASRMHPLHLSKALLPRHGTRLSPGSHTSCCLVGETEIQRHTVIHHQVWGGPHALAEPITMPPGIWGGFLQVVTSELRFTG